MSALGGLLGIGPGAVAAVVGCGGKTSIIGLLAREHASLRVLVSPTTQIRPMTEGVVACLDSEAACAAHRAVPGVQCLGMRNHKGKLGALPQALLERILPDYQLALLEADGSRNLPCKGWGSFEPVIPGACTHTVGVVTLRGLGRPADEEHVLRLPRFLALTGLGEGEPITLEALARMVCEPEGMFRNAVGERALVVNAVEDPDGRTGAVALLERVRALAPWRFGALVLGSAHENRWEAVNTEVSV